MSWQIGEASVTTGDLPQQRVDEAVPATRSVSLQRFSRQVAWTLATRLLMTVNSIGAGVIVARWLGAEGLGALAVINVAVATVVQVGSMGLPSANTYFIARDNRQLPTVAINSLVFVVFVGGLLALGMTALAGRQPDIFSSISPRLVGIAAASIPFQLVTLLGLNVFLALGRTERFNFLDLAGQSLVLINAGFALIVLKRGLLTLVWLNTATSLILSLLIAVLVWRAITSRTDKPIWRPRAEVLAAMIRYGLKFQVSIVAGMLVFRADLLVVNHFRGAAEAGVYAVASQVAMFLMLLPGVTATLLFPRVIAEQHTGGETTCMVTRHTAFFMLLICVAAALASFMLPLLYGARFAGATWQLLILLPGVYLVGLQSVLVQHFNAAGLPRAIPLFWLATLLTNLALVFTLVPGLGAPGAAVASTISYGLIFLLVALYFRARTSHTLRDVFFLSGAELRDLFTRRRFSLFSKRV